MTPGITLSIGDITAERVCAIVNAANSALIPGAGVAGAVHEHGGPEILAECRAHGPIEVGAALLTGAGRLPARFVIHAAVMAPGGAASAASVRRAAQSALRHAREQDMDTLAFPALGAGVGGLSLQESAGILLREARRCLADPEARPREIRFVLFDEPSYRVFEAVQDSLSGEAADADVNTDTHTTSDTDTDTGTVATSDTVTKTDTDTTTSTHTTSDTDTDTGTDTGTVATSDTDTDTSTVTHAGAGGDDA